MTSTTAKHPTFIELVQCFENRPIRNSRDLRKAYRIIDFSKADIRKLCEFFRVAPGAWL